MRKDDFQDFCQMLDDSHALLARGQMPSPTAKAMFFRALATYPLDTVRSGFDGHVKDPQRGRFAPTPADIVAQIEGLAADDGRPGPEEAWAMCARANDEDETVVWSDEMAQAWQVSSSVMENGDEVGARMAFKEAYNRIVEQARRARAPVNWNVSLGHDPQRREATIVRAEVMGLLPQGESLRLAAPEYAAGNALSFLLETSVRRSGDAVSDPAEIKRRAAELKALLVKKAEPDDRAERAREELEARKALAAQQVAAYTQQLEGKQA